MLTATVPPSKTQDTPALVLHDARTVHDIASLPLSEYTANGQAAWVLAAVSPESKSGSATIPGATVSPATGRMVIPEGAGAVVLKEGSWTSIASAPQDQQYKEGGYSWTEPVAQRRRAARSEDYYSPFSKGGTILFRPVQEASGIGAFGPVALLFKDWAVYVEPALRFIDQHPASFAESTPSATDLAQVEEALSGRNELLAALAFRQLILAKMVTSVLCRTQLDRAGAHLAPVLTYIVLAAPPAGGKAGSLVEATLNVVDASVEIGKLRSIGLGAFAAGLFGSSNPAMLAASKRVLLAVHKQAKRLGPVAEDDSYLHYIFEKMGVPR